MPKDDPPRLKQSPEAPLTLVRALEALRKGADESSRLERVAGKLGPLLDAAPKAATVGGTARHKLTALKLIIGGLALLAPALWMLRSELIAKPQAAAVQTPATVRQATSIIVPAIAAPDTTRQDKASAPADRVYHGKVRPAQSVKPLARGRQQSAEARSVASAPALAASPPPSAPTPRPVEQQASTPNPEPRNPGALQPTAAHVAAITPAARSEAELLFDARKAMPHDAPLALQLLGEHEQRYPKGQLVPEREVLAIEALRSLGRTAEADARLLRFKARYPNSFHLQRLQR